MAKIYICSILYIIIFCQTEYYFWYKCVYLSDLPFMPAGLKNFSEISLLKLIDLIRIKSGNQLETMADCKKFSDELAKEFSINLSNFTIARLTGVVNSKSLPSGYTLDSLSAYCGYTDWQSFVALNRNEIREGRNKILNPSDSLFSEVSINELMLLQSCIENKAFIPVIDYLYKMAPAIIDNLKNGGEGKIVRLLANAISKSEEVRNALIPAIARDINTRNLYFNAWVDMDGINIYYGDIVEHYYLKNIRPTSDSFRENDIWAWCMIMYKHLYSQNLKKFLKTGYSLFKRYNADEITNESIPNYYPVARFHACQIMYKFFSSPCTPASWYEKKLQFILSEVHSIPMLRQIVFIPQIAEALYVAGQHELIFAFTPHFNHFLEENIEEHEYKIELDCMQKLMFYMHLALDKAGKFETVCKGGNDLIGKKVNLNPSTEELYLYDYMNLVVQSMYEHKPEVSRNFLEHARKIAARLKNRHFEKIAQGFIERSTE